MGKCDDSTYPSSSGVGSSHAIVQGQQHRNNEVNVSSNGFLQLPLPDAALIDIEIHHQAIDDFSNLFMLFKRGTDVVTSIQLMRLQQFKEKLSSSSSTSTIVTERVSTDVLANTIVAANPSGATTSNASSIANPSATAAQTIFLGLTRMTTRYYGRKAKK